MTRHIRSIALLLLALALLALLAAPVWLLADAARADEPPVLPTSTPPGWPGSDPYPGPYPGPEPEPEPDAYPGPAYLPVVVEMGGEAYP